MFKPLKTIIRYVGVTLLVVSMLVLIVLTLAQFVFYKQLSARLKQAIETNDEMGLRVEQIGFNVFTRSITATKITAQDSTGFFSVTCDSIRIQGINPLPLFFERSVVVSTIRFSGGNLGIDLNKNQPVVKNRKTSWLVKTVIVNNVQVDIANKKNSAHCKIHTLRASRLDSKSTYTIPAKNAEVLLTDLQLHHEGQTFLLDSIGAHYQDGFSTIQANNVDVLKLIRFFTQPTDSIFSSLQKFWIDKIQVCVPVYYFKYASLKKLPKVEVPWLQIDGSEVHLHSSKRSLETPIAISSKSIPIDMLFEQLSIKNGKFWVYRDSLPQLEFELKELKGNNLRTDSTHASYPVFADALAISLADLHYQLDDQIHQINIHNLNYETGLNRIQAEGIQMGSELDADVYFKQRRFQTDMPSLALHAMMFDELNIHELLNNNTFRFRKIWADTLELTMTRDKNYPYDLKNFPPMIQDQILELPIVFSVDTVSLQNGMITYYEIPKGATLEGAGMFRFTAASLNMYRCTNDTSMLVHNDTLMIHFRGKLYDQGLLDVFVDIPLLSKNYWHRVYGTIGKFNAREFNRITIPAAAVKINKGTINGGEFYFEATNQFSTGNAELLFEKLKVTVLNKTGSAAQSQADFLKSLIANVFMVHDNPEPGKDVMVGKIYFKRNTNRWMINFWWKSMLQGVRSIVFAKEVQLREMSTSFNEYKKLRKQREEMDQLNTAN